MFYERRGQVRPLKSNYSAPVTIETLPRSSETLIIFRSKRKQRDRERRLPSTRMIGKVFPSWEERPAACAIYTFYEHFMKVYHWVEIARCWISPNLPFENTWNLLEHLWYFLKFPGTPLNPFGIPTKHRELTLKPLEIPQNTPENNRNPP